MTAALFAAALVGLAVLLAGHRTSGRVDAARKGQPVGRASSRPGLFRFRRLWSRRMWSSRLEHPRPLSRRPAPPTATDVAMVMDLLAAGLTAGLPPARALETAGRCYGGAVGEALVRVSALWLLGAPPAAVWEGSPAQLEPLRRVLHLVATAGVPGVTLLRSAADELRRRERRSGEARAQALGVRMVLPIGLCALPAFVAWAVVPVVLSLAAQVLG